MPWYDLPPEQLPHHRTTTPEPEDLDEFWAHRLMEAQAAAAPTTLQRHGTSTYGALPVWDVTFSGAGGDPVRGWYLRPAGVDDAQPLPVVVRFVGYGGGRGVPVEHLDLPATGFAALVMDTRGQGGDWTVGATGDPGRAGEGPEHAGVMTRGIASPLTYYYTRLITDAARAVEVAASLPGADRSRIAVMGGSQGGGLALAAAALRPELVRACVADVPFLCDIRRAITLTAEDPYAEIAGFLAQHADLVDAALDTLSYVDCALLARRVVAATLVGVGLMDAVCPPSTVYAAYAELAGPKELAVYPFGVHDLPRSHTERALRYLRERL
jgi:cephalosporin-C deacetylase